MHTPGPWIMDERSESLKGSNGQRVVVWSCGLSFGNRTPETEANAKLIAAAPELLAALQELLATSVTYSEEMTKIGRGHYELQKDAPAMTVADVAQQAINKALGR